MPGAVITLTKPVAFSAWEAGNGRLSEISIEQYFGHLRGQFVSGQMTARSFCAAAARQDLKTSKLLDLAKPRRQRSEKPLSDTELLASTK